MRVRSSLEEDGACWTTSPCHGLELKVSSDLKVRGQLYGLTQQPNSSCNYEYYWYIFKKCLCHLTIKVQRNIQVTSQILDIKG